MSSEGEARPVVDLAVLERALSAVVVLGTGAVLGIALWLDPAPIGFGTHTQLGLGECSFLTLTGQPCPMCGATTSFALMAHVHPFQALVNQPFASLLFLMTVGAFAVSLAEAVRPQRRWTRLLERVEPVEHWLAIGFLGLMGASWIWKAAVMGGWFAQG